MFNSKARKIKALEARLDLLEKYLGKYRRRYNSLYVNICEVLAGADDPDAPVVLRSSV